MNPFDLPGPEFLLFYTVLGAAFLGVLELWRRYTENTAVPKVNLTDPYQIAFLRGGKNEALRIATIALIDRGFIDAKDTTLKSKPNIVNLVKRPIEQSVLAYFSKAHDAWSVFSGVGGMGGTKQYEDELRQWGLLPTTGQWRLRYILRAVAAAVLILVACQKFDIAIHRGHHNILFLILLAMAFTMAVFCINPRRTPAGDTLLKDLRELFGSLKDRASSIKPGGATNELALALGVFGVGVISGTAGYSFIQKLYPKASSSLSSCGTSCGSSCGSSCGGGGCGGGCGGCGG